MLMTRLLCFILALLTSEVSFATEKTKNHQACQALFRAFERSHSVFRGKTYGVIQELSAIRKHNLRVRDVKPDVYFLNVNSEHTSQRKKVASQILGIERHYEIAGSEEAPEFKVRGFRLEGEQQIENFLSEIESFQEDFGKMIKDQKKFLGNPNSFFYKFVTSSMLSVGVFFLIYPFINQSSEGWLVSIPVLLMNYPALLKKGTFLFLKYLESNQMTLNLRKSFESLKQHEGWSYQSESFVFSRGSQKQINQLSSSPEERYSQLYAIDENESFNDFQMRLPLFKRFNRNWKDLKKEWVGVDFMMMRNAGRPVELFVVLRSSGEKPKFPRKKAARKEKTLIEQAQGSWVPVRVR
ncbi:MAG: hypothetical protein CL678_16325 [Bdellovibrionaceae bacterium]|nr:hypothetical protein [Pseudobdellovibrionaceae bacterium]